MRIGCLVAKYNDGSYRSLAAGPDINGMKALKKEIKVSGGMEGIEAVYLFIDPVSKDRYKEKPSAQVEEKKKPQSKKV